MKYETIEEKEDEVGGYIGKMQKIKADLHMHGPIGFQDYWLKVQGYQGRNLAKEIVDTAIDKNLEISAITSAEFDIPKDSTHDRFNKLIEYTRDLPKDIYSHDKIGKNILVVEKRGSKPVYIINGQTVIVYEGGKRIHHLVVGANQVPNKRNLQDTISYCNDNGLIQIAEHMFCGDHFGAGRELIERYLKDYDAIEGHNSQMILPQYLSFIPKIGKYSKGVNIRAIKFAEQSGKPWVADSDAHRIEDEGISYIEFYKSLLDTKNESNFFTSLKKIIKSGNFENHQDYEKPLDWINWVSKFFIGTKLGKDKI